MIEKNIRSMVGDDVRSVVDIHLVAFQGFFLSFLGARFLKELYSAIIRDPDGISFVCEEDKRIEGFIAGTNTASSFYRRLIISRWWRFGLACIGPIFKKPVIIPRLLRAFRKPNDEMPLPDCGILMSIAVLPAEQGKGIGKLLIQAFLTKSKHIGLKHITLTTDFINNERVNHFYMEMGFRCIRTYATPEGRTMNEYMVDL